MKLVVPTIKPRAKQLNAVLLSKRCERHSDGKTFSRSRQKRDTMNQVKLQTQE